VYKGQANCKLFNNAFRSFRAFVNGGSPLILVYLRICLAGKMDHSTGGREFCPKTVFFPHSMQSANEIFELITVASVQCSNDKFRQFSKTFQGQKWHFLKISDTYDYFC
jgi:hypothetical protein